ncbi:MAG: VVA0879 family protein [Planctomycetota bacterium]|jgi:hypothetical protein
MREISHKDWKQEARALFGDDALEWRFVCPACGHTASVHDWKNAGASTGEVAFSCVGRRLRPDADMGTKPGPCNYAGGGLFALNPVKVLYDDGTVQATFEFAKPQEPKR